jgi:hypothetical protein
MFLSEDASTSTSNNQQPSTATNNRQQPPTTRQQKVNNRQQRVDSSQPTTHHPTFSRFAPLTLLSPLPSPSSAFRFSDAPFSACPLSAILLLAALCKDTRPEGRRGGGH